MPKNQLILKSGPVRRWIRALRSGKYPQGTGQLASDGHYCCLGVACELMGDNLTKENISGSIRYNGSFVVLPTQAQRHYFAGSDKQFEALQTKLIEMNDTKQKSFKQIADFLERKLKQQEAKTA